MKRAKAYPHILILAVLIYLFTAPFSVAQNFRNKNGDTASLQLNTITTAVPFLLIAPDSRAGGLGDAGVASSPDANSMHHNPSKFAFMDKKLGLSVSYVPWLRALVNDINLAYLSVYYKTSKEGAVAGTLRYFSLGDIQFTDINGQNIGQFRPNEFALDLAYAQRLSKRFSASMTGRYIYSNLTGGLNVQGSNTKAGQSFAVDLSGYYRNNELEIDGKKSTFTFGFNISNIGAKMSYSDRNKRDFIPINLKLGPGLIMNLDQYNQIAFLFEINKLLVPTPPIYQTDAGGNPIRDADGNLIISKGKDPNRGVAEGMIGSFSDAPNGFNEEMREYNLSGGIEYWYDKQFAVRVGYFNEDRTKGNRKFFTAGLGLKYNVFGLDFAYLIPIQQRNPLSNTLRFTLLFDFDAFNEQNKEIKEE